MPAKRVRSALFVPVALFFVWISFSKASDLTAPSPKDSLCVACFKVRVGVPIVEQGPVPDKIDNVFTEIELPGGRLRGFTAAGETYAIDGKNPMDMSGPLRKALGRAPRGKYGESGKWINHAERSGNVVWGWVHDETGDAPGQGLKSMSIAISKDDGLNWDDVGQIIVGTDSLTHGRVTGEGDCTAVNGEDGYYYAYCWRNTNGAEIVARAPVSDPRPGKWKKFYTGEWDQPGVRGESTGLPKGTGGSAARWTRNGEILLLGGTHGGMGLQFSKDEKTFTDFTPLAEPLMDLDSCTWNRPAPCEIVAYQDLLDAKTGSNQLSDSWFMAYMYLQPNEGFDKRYLVFRRVEVSISDTPVVPQVGILLARWYDGKLKDRWATTAAVPAPRGSTYKLEKELGYLMTIAEPGKQTVKWRIAPAIGRAIRTTCSTRSTSAMRDATSGCVRRDGSTTNRKSTRFRSTAVTTRETDRILYQANPVAKTWGRWSTCSDTH
jgi:hypothetical protein